MKVPDWAGVMRGSQALLGGAQRQNKKQWGKNDLKDAFKHDNNILLL